MNIFKFAWKNLWHKPLSTSLNLTLFAFGVSIISTLFLAQNYFQKTLEKNKAGIGMVIGAKGSPLQLILCAIYQVDNPTGNILLKDAMRLKKHPLIDKAIPQSLGDNYKGYRIVGTTHEYTALYEAEIQEGKMWNENKAFEVTVGANVARKLGLKIGDEFHSSHGMDEGGHSHEEELFIVVGTLKTTGTVIDNLIMTSLKSIWDVHQHAPTSKVNYGNFSDKKKEQEKSHNKHDDHDEHEEHGHDEHAHKHEEHGHDENDHKHDEHEEHEHDENDHKHDEHEEHDHDEHDHKHDEHEKHDHDEHDHKHDEHEEHDHDEHDHKHDEHEGHDHDEAEKEITTLLVKFRNPMGAVVLPRMINEQTSMQAASPAYETARLLSLVGDVILALKYLAVAIIVVSGLSIFISLYNSLKERKYELAYMRSLGTKQSYIFGLLLTEGLLCALLGFVIGIAISHTTIAVSSTYIDALQSLNISGLTFTIEELYLFLGTISIGFIASIVPAIQAANTNISQALSE
ncbi:ABC transporter permease [Flammeovirga sp. EKP202]|uniref:ABC transporter permease n=1 Tax=Flammeovirga sp. EKP202 TaxID=2770592 RepID=UPI00165FE874|nr:ABC transporter permease [Flammeovirga sp. EKP202]MBD0405212.1 ABC transporter permease [Flammeovirga sp. EKP202]